MFEQKNILFTGGSGLLGKEFKKNLPFINYPSSSEFDVVDFEGMENYLANRDISLLIHAAAFTSPPNVDKDPINALEINIIGTANVVKLCSARQIKLIYISTDYVFDGKQGNYCENDPVFPVNKYAWSKLGGECAVRLYDKSLIIRTSFGPNIFPYEKAFVDQWTSRESVSTIAKKIGRLINLDTFGVLHLGGERMSVYDYARGLEGSQDVTSFSIKEVAFDVPIDTSLNCSKYIKLINGKR